MARTSVCKPGLDKLRIELLGNRDVDHAPGSLMLVFRLATGNAALMLHYNAMTL